MFYLGKEQNIEKYLKPKSSVSPHAYLLKTKCRVHSFGLTFLVAALPISLGLVGNTRGFLQSWPRGFQKMGSDLAACWEVRPDAKPPEVSGDFVPGWFASQALDSGPIRSFRKVS